MSPAGSETVKDMLEKSPPPVMERRFETAYKFFEQVHCSKPIYTGAAQGKTNLSVTAPKSICKWLEIQWKAKQRYYHVKSTSLIDLQ